MRARRIHHASWLVLCSGLLAALPWPAAPRMAQAQALPPGKKVALLIGVNKYDKRGFRDLAFAERDVQELGQVLEPAGYEVHVLTAGSSGTRRATLKNIKAALETALKDRTKRDLMLIALAGHGLQIEVAGPDGKLQAESFFCPADAEQSDPKTMLSIGALFEDINRRGGGRNLVLVDACREDPTRGRGMDGTTVKTLPEGVAVLFGCASGQKTYESEKAGGGHGVFFHAVIAGLQGEAKKNDVGELTWHSLVEYVTERVERDAERWVGRAVVPQTPNLVTNLRGRSPVVLPRPFAGAKAGQEADENGLAMKFCWCPPGKFTMGSPKEEPDRSSDEDQVEVTLRRGYWLGKFEVTQSQWERLMGMSLRKKGESFDPPAVPNGEGADHPMYWVHFDEAAEFCRKLTAQERQAGRLPADWEYRLPTEAQWEYACRAGTTTATAFGDMLSSKQANFDGERPYNGAEKGENIPTTAPVGNYDANAWGFHDMHGNVWEWCRDWYQNQLPGGEEPEVSRVPFRRLAGLAKGDTYVMKTEKTDFYVDGKVVGQLAKDTEVKVVEEVPGWLRAAASIGGKEQTGWFQTAAERFDPRGRVERGGGQSNPGSACRSACRNSGATDERFNNTGFRVAIVKLDATQVKKTPDLLAAPFTQRDAKTKQQEWARQLGKTGTVTENSLGMKFVLIPPGEFLAGGHETAAELIARFPEEAKAGAKQQGVEAEELFRYERPQHKVRITQPFFLGMHEVTLNDFLKFIHATKYEIDAIKDGIGGPGYLGKKNEKGELFEARAEFVPWSWGFKDQTEKHPVVNVSWNDAVAFCEWLSKKEAKTYRLPTEAEWEYASRAGASGRYYFGDNPEDLAKWENVADATSKELFASTEAALYIKARDGHALSAPVGSFPANPFGLHDMLGNVREFCLDPLRGYDEALREDPRGIEPTDSAQTARAVRGGSWDYSPSGCRCAWRYSFQATERSVDVGFRVLCEP